MSRHLEAATLLAALLGALAMACPSDSTDGAPPASEGDALGDVATGDALDPGDVTASGDASTTDAKDATADVGAPVPVAPFEEPTPLEVEEWRVAYVNGGSDPIYGAIEDGTFAFPDAGVQGGVYWMAKGPGENGAFASPKYGDVLYAVARVDTAASTGLIVRADAMSHVFLNGARQPGDPYHSRALRVPLRTQEGENLIVFRGYATGNPPEAELWETNDEVAFNLSDLTTPDLLAGETTLQYLGVPVLNLTHRALLDVRAKVVETEQLEASELRIPALGPEAVTAVAFELLPKPGLEADVPIRATVRVESPSLDWAYEREVELTPVPADSAPIKRTFLSPMDGSAQYYGLMPPTSVEPGQERSLLLSLHGAGVQGIGQAGAYGQKDWIYVAAPTNRRPFGFDWEVWGRRDALEVLDHAMATLPIDPTRVYVAGHSMGGHGTWQMGVLFPGRFAVVSPSAGWISFATYGGAEPFPEGPLGWARASSDTLRYIENLAKRAVYVIHGSADDNVPVGQARTMVEALEPICPDLTYHEEPDAGHWWDGDASPGADCVDWPPLFDVIESRTLDPTELDFQFISPSPWVSPTHSYATILSKQSPAEDAVLQSSLDGTTVTLDTQNVRSLRLDGPALAAKGVKTIVVDGDNLAVGDGPIEVGPQSGKRPGQGGPYNEVLEQPFCYVYPDDGPDEYRRYAAYLLSTWDVIGNGHGCALPLSALTAEVRAERNLIYLGIPEEQVPIPSSIQLGWDDGAITLAGVAHSHAAAIVVFPEDERLSAVIVATAGDERLLFRVHPYTSRFVVPDYLVWSDQGAQAVGFFDGEWTFDSELGVP